MGELRILGANGDRRVAWNGDSENEIATAKRTCDQKRKEGFLATKNSRRGIEGDRICAFNRHALLRINEPIGTPI